MKKILPKTLVTIVSVLLPTLAFAQDPGAVDTLLLNLEEWVNALVPVVMVIAVLVFFWGIVMYITAGADEEKRGKARNLMIYGVIGLFVMVSIWGLVKFIGTTLGVGQGGTIEPVKLPGVR